MAYTDTTALKRYLGITGTGDDTLLGELIARSQAVIDSTTGRTFEASSDTERTFDAVQDVDGAYLRLDGDLCAVTTITNGDGTIVTSSQYVTEPRNKTPFHRIKLLTSSGVAWTYTTDPEDAISIVGKWAYSATAPADIVQVCVRLAAYLYRQKDNAGDLDRAVIAGNATILPASIPSDIYAILTPYRRRTI